MAASSDALTSRQSERQFCGNTAGACAGSERTVGVHRYLELRGSVRAFFPSPDTTVLDGLRGSETGHRGSDTGTRGSGTGARAPGLGHRGSGTAAQRPGSALTSACLLLGVTLSLAQVPLARSLGSGRRKFYGNQRSKPSGSARRGWTPAAGNFYTSARANDLFRAECGSYAFLFCFVFIFIFFCFFA